MKSTCKIAYIAALALSAFSLTPTRASAQSTRGNFTLTHEVRWQNVAVPAGEYKFSVESRGPSVILMLHKISGPALGFMIFVNDTDAEQPYAVTAKADGKIVVVSESGTRYVSTMELPEAGLTLHFAVPEPREVAANTLAASAYHYDPSRNSLPHAELQTVNRIGMRMLGRSKNQFVSFKHINQAGIALHQRRGKIDDAA